MNPNPPPDFVGLVFLVALPAFFASILLVLSMLGGWRKLAERFANDTAIAGTTWWLQSAGIRRYVTVTYNHCLTVTVNDEGIGLSVLFPVRLWHPPLFIAWSEVQVSQERRFFFIERVRLSIAAEPSTWIEITTRLAEKIQTTLGHDWFETAG